jgi:hypothetical protein
MSGQALTFGLRQLADRLRAEGKSAYECSRRIRAQQETHPRTREMVNVSPDDMYELGYAEGRSSALDSAADWIAHAAEIAAPDPRDGAR